MGTLTVLLRACWLPPIIGQIAISDAGVLVSCLPQEPNGIRIYASQGAEKLVYRFSSEMLDFKK